ncbi:MAG: DNA cytosine methyltransferase [Prevotella sp.]|nr:DNA cytosine methyltransferase [Prevotella sp.]
MDNIKLLYIDLFCGAGGTSTGVELAKLNGEKCAKVIACVNHDKNAILSHAANHPDVMHFTEDIRTLELSPLVKHLNAMRNKHPEALVVLWASCECTNFSRAKGGLPRDADSRTLAEHLFRYIETLNPDYIEIENVVEFMCWGELDENGKPVSKYNGKCYIKWANKIQRYGYNYDFRILNAADFGAYTSRKRYFGQFARTGLPIVFPEQTYAKPNVAFESQVCGNLFPNQYKPWKAVREVLDLDDEGQSIFMRNKPLCEKTLERIYAGLVKFVAGGKKNHDAWILKYNSMKEGHYNAPSLEDPCPTVAVQNRLGLVKCNFLSKQFSGDPMSKNQSLEQPAGAITTIDHHAFVTAYFGNGFNSSIDNPSPTITTKDRYGIVQPDFLVSYRFNNKGSSVDEPAPTVCTVGQIGVARCRFLDLQYGNGSASSLENPSPVVMGNPKQNLVTVDKFLMNPQYASAGGSIDRPCFTLIARTDKMPPYLVSTEQGEVSIAVFEDDSPMTRQIKEFMAMYGIYDIKMRMLNIRELKRIMGFPENYILIGTQAEQKKYIGNAVEVNMSRALCEALCEKLSDNENTIAV